MNGLKFYWVEYFLGINIILFQELRIVFYVLLFFFIDSMLLMSYTEKKQKHT